MATGSGESPIQHDLWEIAKKRWIRDAAKTVDDVLTSSSENYRRNRIEFSGKSAYRGAPSSDIQIFLTKINENSELNSHPSGSRKKKNKKEQNAEKWGYNILLDKRYRPGLLMILIDLILNTASMLFS